MLLQYSYVSLQVLAGSEKTTVSIALTIRSQNSGKVEIIEEEGPQQSAHESNEVPHTV